MPQHKHTENTRRQAGSHSCKKYTDPKAHIHVYTHIVLHVHILNDVFTPTEHMRAHTYPEPVCYDSEGSSWNEGSSGGGELSPSGGVHICLPPQLAA